MLRHTCVVWSLAEGVPIQLVSEMIGHTSLQMTYDVYGGLVNLHDPVMAQAMARALLTAGQAGPCRHPAPMFCTRPPERWTGALWASLGVAIDDLAGHRLSW
jgi:hypothetical protein